MDLQYHHPTKQRCPRCGNKLVADDIGHYFLKCETCGWKGSLLDVAVRRAESKQIEVQ